MFNWKMYLVTDHWKDLFKTMILIENNFDLGWLLKDFWLTFYPGGSNFEIFNENVGIVIFHWKDFFKAMILIKKKLFEPGMVIKTFG